MRAQRRTIDAAIEGAIIKWLPLAMVFNLADWTKKAQPCLLQGSHNRRQGQPQSHLS
jgi:hypothetical protein